MFDVDFFKQVNDIWGYDSGDWVLVEIVWVMEFELCEYDFCGCWGGEEFFLLLLQICLQDVGLVFEWVCDSVWILVVCVGIEVLSVIVSVGVIEYCIGEIYLQIVNCVDVVLFDVKCSGCDKCVFVVFLLFFVFFCLVLVC